MTARWITADVFDGLATLDDGTVDLVVTSPPFLALRSYLPADHPDKAKEIGSEPTPAAFIDVMLAVTAELRRVLAPHGSIAIELGDTYAGSGGAGGDYGADGLRDGQERFDGSAVKARANGDAPRPGRERTRYTPDGWPLAKSKTLIPELYRIALAYGINPLTGQESPAGRWRVRNVVTWCRPNPPVGALGDKWRPATSDVVVACTSDKRYWDDIATRRPHSPNTHARNAQGVVKRENTTPSGQRDGNWNTLPISDEKHPAGAPLLDYWEIPPGGYPGAHYAVYPPALVEPLIKAMAPPKVCRTCGEPSRRIVETSHTFRGENFEAPKRWDTERQTQGAIGVRKGDIKTTAKTLGWTDCGHDDYRPALVLDPFAGSGTTLAVATGHGHDAIGIDLDPRNADLARDRIGPFLFEEATA